MKENFSILFFYKFKKPGIGQLFFRLVLILFALGIMTPHTPVKAQVAQGIAVTGSVTDGATGEPLMGVNIVVQGTLTGTVTDLTGKFSINVPNEESILVFSFIGYQASIVAVGNQKQISIALQADLATLEEVVVVGYGVQKKESVVGAISQASGDIIRQGVQGADLANALTGALPGLITISTTGIPGGSGEDDDYALMYIRGQKTWNNASPLVLVDGVERPLQNINPYEIEKISLLKDASATAVFGVKGANGVILITTQRGKEGKPQLSFDATYTMKTISRVPHRLGSYEANLMKNYAILNEVPISEGGWGYITPEPWLQLYKNHTYPEYLPDVDWLEEFTKDFAQDRTVNMTISGGTKIVKYFGSLAYLHEGDILDMKDVGQGYTPSFLFDRLNFRSNLDFDITSTTRFSVNLSGFYSNQQRPAGDKYRGWQTFYSSPPDLWPAQYSDGYFGDYAAYSRHANGVYTYSFFGYSKYKTTNINTDFVFDQKLDFVTKGLSANAKLSYDNTSLAQGPNITGYGRMEKWISPNIVDAITPGMTAAEIKALEPAYTTWLPPRAASTTGYDYRDEPNTYAAESAASAQLELFYRSLYYQFSLNYGRDFGKHAVSALALMSRQVRATGSNFPSYREDWVGRVTYGYDRRYNFEFNAAYNGSEKFSEKYRFGFFPSMAVGWTVSNESFFESFKPVINNLKFRYSDGVVGSDEGIARWLYVGSWNVLSGGSTDDQLRFGYPTLQPAYPLRYEGVTPNPEIQWETSHKQDIGIETGFFSNQLKVSFDYFREDRTNIFLTGSERAVPDYLGASPVSANIGQVKMHGWEIEAQFSKTTAGGFNYWFTHSWSFAIDKIIEKGDPILKPDYQKQAGYQIGQPRVTLRQTTHPLQTWNNVYNTVIGQINTDLLPGDYSRVDYDADGIITSNDAVPYGYPARPQYNYAPSVGFTYKNLSGNLRFYGVYNVEGEVGTYFDAFAYQFNTVYPWNRDNAWSPELGHTTDATDNGLKFTRSSYDGYYAKPRNYLKLQHAEIAYKIAVPWIRKMGISNLRLLLSGDNLILWSKMYEDFDSDRPTAQTNTRRMYPKFRRFNFGVSFNFQ